MKPKLEGIYIGSGVSARTREPFCHVTVQLSDGSVHEGQLTPDEVRKMAGDWMVAAEASVHDAAVFQLLTKDMDLDEEVAAAFIAKLRDHRHEEWVDIPEPDGET